MSAPIVVSTSTPTTTKTMASPRPRFTNYDVIIVGAGIAGCALAQGLALADGEAKRRILLIDLHVGPSPRFSGEFIHPRGVAVLDAFGLLAPLRARGALLTRGFAVHDPDQAREVVLDYRELAQRDPRRDTPTEGLGVHHHVLVEVLREEVRKRNNVECCEGWRVQDLIRENGRFTGVVVAGRNASGGLETHRIAADLIVAADGKSSPTRKLAGIDDARRSLGFTAGIVVPNAATPHPDHAVVLVGAPGPVLCYPILKNDDGTVLHRLTFDLPQTHLPARGKALAHYLRAVYFPILPPALAAQCVDALRLSGDNLEIAPTVDLPAIPAHHPGLVLVGDAAGCSHPVTASGMTMALFDAKALADLAGRRTSSGGGSLRARLTGYWPFPAASQRPSSGPSSEASRMLTDDDLARYQIEHDRYVPTRQALADAIAETLRGESLGARAIRTALFDYWEASAANRRDSLALLACDEARPRVFISEYIRTARHAAMSCLRPRYAPNLPWSDRANSLKAAANLATSKLGVAAHVTWAQIRPGWVSRRSPRAET